MPIEIMPMEAEAERLRVLREQTRDRAGTSAKERPMLMSAPMVRAILDGSKTQTRRIVKGLALDWLYRDGFTAEFTAAPENSLCPYGQPGDRLWVRESYMPDPPDDGTWAGTAWRGCKGSRLEDIPDRFRSTAHCLYRSTWSGSDLVGWRPSIHMPRWASRITLEITSVRVERLQDISDDDLTCEGLQEVIDAGVDHDGTPRDAWRALWSQINGSESWAANPWVWVIEFRRAAP